MFVFVIVLLAWFAWHAVSKQSINPSPSLSALSAHLSLLVLIPFLSTPLQFHLQPSVIASLLVSHPDPVGFGV